MNCTMYGGFVWNILCVVGLYELYNIWWVCLEYTVCGGFV